MRLNNYPILTKIFVCIAKVIVDLTSEKHREIIVKYNKLYGTMEDEWQKEKIYN